MGFVSYFEDLAERLAADLEEARAELIADRQGIPSSEGKINAIFRQIDRILSELRSHLDMATDPQLDLVNKVQFLERENASLRQSIGELERNEKKIQERYLAKSKEVSEKGKEIQRLRKEVKKREKEFDRAFRKNTEAGYHIFSSPGRIQKGKG